MIVSCECTLPSLTATKLPQKGMHSSSPFTPPAMQSPTRLQPNRQDVSPPPPPPNPPTPRQCGNLCIFASHQVSHVYLVFLHGMCSLVCFTAVLCPDKFQLLPASLLVLTPVVGCNLVQQGGQGGVSIQEPGDHATGLSDSDSQPMTVSQ